MKVLYPVIGLFLSILLAGCTSATAEISPSNDGYASQDSPANTSNNLIETPAPTKTNTLQLTVTLNSDHKPIYGYTHHNVGGNRFVTGLGRIPELTPLDIPLPGPASWVVAVPWGDGSLWAVILESGQALGFQVAAEGWEPAQITPSNLQPGQPPLLSLDRDTSTLLLPPSSLASPTTHAIPLDNLHLSQVFIDNNGDLIRVDPNLRQLSPIPVDALPDARILSDGQGHLILLSGPTDRYDHGVLGDAIEASSITFIPNPLFDEASVLITIPGDLVIEGISPIWADLTGDGEKEIIVTVSNASQGAQILVFNTDGQQIAAGPAIGQGYRWRHQIVVAPFGPNGELELVDVLTPHLGGVVEFYRLEGDQITIVAQVPGYTSHVIGSRNLDMAAAADFDSDGSIELLIPLQDRSELGAIRRIGDDAQVVWSLTLDGQMSTNLGAVTLPDSGIAIGVGQENGILQYPYSLRIWHP
jgi:hypothetical protein